MLKEFKHQSLETHVVEFILMSFFMQLLNIMYLHNAHGIGESSETLNMLNVEFSMLNDEFNMLNVEFNMLNVELN